MHSSMLSCATHNEHVGDGDVERDVCVHDVQQGLVHEVHAEAQPAKGEESIPRQESVNETWDFFFLLTFVKVAWLSIIITCITVDACKDHPWEADGPHQPVEPVVGHPGRHGGTHARGLDLVGIHDVQDANGPHKGQDPTPGNKKLKLGYC